MFSYAFFNMASSLLRPFYNLAHVATIQNIEIERKKMDITIKDWKNLFLTTNHFH
jgi:hypothetical protein